MKFSTDILCNPEIFKINTVTPHSSHIHYRNEQECHSEESSFYMSLNGNWKFCFSNNLGELPESFENYDFDDSKWDSIQVPSHIQMSGYGQMQYVNTMYPWDGQENCRPGEIPQRSNQTGSYIKWFELPENWSREQSVRIIFHGAETAMALWINGEFVGYSEDSFTPAEFDITGFLRSGRNKIAVQVYQRSSGSWLEDQDFWRFSGLFRDVELYCIPSVHIEDLFVHTALGCSYEKAEISVDIRTVGDKSGTVRAELFDTIGNLIGEQHISANAENIKFTVESPILWSAENPALYRLKLTVYGSDSEICEIIPQAVGIRHFCMDNGIMKLNGKRIVFKGVNRHEFSCEHGRVVSKEEMLWDVITMKQHNINAVRTSHYPNNNYFYRLCDEYGLYVIDEANLESHGTWQKMGAVSPDENTVPNDNPKWTEAVLSRAEAMLERDKNHPCVLIWSCGNESYGGSNIFKMSELFRHRDSSRLVHYEGVVNDRRYNSTSDMESQMYPSVSRIEEYLKNNSEKPFICCEYSHAMGNSNGGLFKYTDLEKREPRYQGGFIWDFIDQGIRSTDRYGNPFIAFGGDYGDRPTDYNFCVNGIVFADRTLSPKMAEVKFCYQPFEINCNADEITLCNSFLFTDTQDYKMRLKLCRSGEAIAETVWEDFENVPPQESRSFKMPFAADTSLPGEYVLTVSMEHKASSLWAKAGDEAAFGQAVWNVGKPEADTACAAPELIVGDVNIGIRTDAFHIIFGKDKCGIVSYKKNDTELIASLVGIPRPNFWRAATDNDNGRQMNHKCAVWKTASLYPASEFVSCTKTDSYAEIITRQRFPFPDGAGCTLTYRFFGNGEIRIDLQLFGCEKLGEMPDFGMLLRMPHEFENIQWYGRGPSESYCDRKRGCKIGVYESSAAEQLTPYVIAQECGNHTDTRWFKVTDGSGNGFLVSADEQFEFSVLPYTPHELENACHPYELPAAHYSVLRISAGQSGIGGDDSWGAEPHPEFIRSPQNTDRFSFTIKAL